MKRINLEHIIRAAGSIADVKEIYIMGSQSILGEHPELDNSVCSNNSLVNMALKYKPQEHILMSREADIIVPDNYKKAEEIEGILGEESNFDNTHGYYAQAIDETTCILPDNWQSRLIKICNQNTNYITGYCLETHDLIISKLVANREKDLDYFKAVCALKLVKKDILLKRIDMTTQLSDNVKERIKSVINREIKNEPSRKIR